jgi:hypothetical protein
MGQAHLLSLLKKRAGYWNYLALILSALSVFAIVLNRGLASAIFQCSSHTEHSQFIQDQVFFSSIYVPYRILVLSILSCFVTTPSLSAMATSIYLL